MPLRSANIIGSGPNGLAAAITLAQRGVAVTVYERNARIGGACSTAETTLPGFHHDLGSSVYPLGVCSPFFTSLPLAAHGLRWIEPPAPLAHPFDDGTALLLEHSLEATTQQFTAHDARAWSHLLKPTVDHWKQIVDATMHPLLSVPKHPLIMARFGFHALVPAETIARNAFHDTRVRALFAACAAHSVLPLTQVGSAAAGLVLAAAAHSTGWPVAAGGAQSLTNALASYLVSLGGRILTGTNVTTLSDLEPADATLFDTSLEAFTNITANAIPPAFTESLAGFKHGPGIFKLDWALSAPIPWSNKSCARAATVHLGGSLEELVRGEQFAFYGHPDQSCEAPFVLLVQPSLFDPARAPDGNHTAWAYIHVPHGSTLDRTETIERQVARFAPGFRDTILARRASTSAELAAWNPNIVGGDISGGAMTLPQLVARPTLRQYRTPNPALYLCSAATPPGGGVHGMCGHLASLAALETLGHSA